MKLKPRRDIPRDTIGYYGEIARPGCRLTYSVSGRGHFPEDMLRYDSAVMVNGEAPTERLTNVTVFEISGNRCTVERWRSFGWSVHDNVREVAL